MTSKELVLKTLEFKNDTGVVPRVINHLPFADMFHKADLDKLCRDFPDDILFGTPGFCSEIAPTK